LTAERFSAEKSGCFLHGSGEKERLVEEQLGKRGGERESERDGVIDTHRDSE